METLLVKLFATALALSQVTTTPDAVQTEFGRSIVEGLGADREEHRPYSLYVEARKPR